MNTALYLQSLQYKETEIASKLTGISTRTLSHIKVEPDKEILVSQKLQSDRIELDDFDKCVVRRTVNEIYGIKRIQFLLDSIKIQLLADINFQRRNIILMRLLRELVFS